jgi:signal transduction histidine kinase
MKQFFKLSQYSFRAQLIYGIGFFLTLLLGVFIYIETTNNSQFLRKRALTQASNHSMVLASMSKVWVMSNDYAGLEEALDNFSVYNDLVFATVVGMDGKVIAHTDKSLVGKYISDERRISFLRRAHSDNIENQQDISRHGYNVDAIRMIHDKDKHIGFVHIRFDQHAREKQIDDVVFRGISFGLLYLILTFLLLYFIVKAFTRQLGNLLVAVKKVHSGDKEVRASEEGFNELSMLSHEFNIMLDAISSSEIALKTTNEHLQELVSEETSRRLEKERLLLQQSKMAMMGEMIGAIAHQWRQPLNSLGLTIQDVEEAYRYGELDEAYIHKFRTKAMAVIQKMSHTIDDFRNFFKPNRDKEEFILEKAVDETINIMHSQLKNHFIEINFNNQSQTLVYGYKGELEQAILIMISNAKDALLENNITNPHIDINIESTDESKVVLSIQDNGGGIAAEIIDRIFEPYFTTKEQGKGTGIGLYMAKEIIERHMSGKLEAENTQNGARFIITLPNVLK